MLSREIREISDCKVLFEVINATEIRVVFYEDVRLTSDNKIIAEKENVCLISLFDEIKLPIDAELQSIYKINYIEQISTRTFNLITSKPTKTSKFLLPILSNKIFNKNTFLFDSYFINAYLDETFNHIYLIYRYSESSVYQNFEREILKHPEFISKEDVSHYKVCLKFKIKEDYYEEVRFFVEGKYSRFSEDYKQMILRFFNYTSSGNMAQILYKSPKRRQQLELDFGVTISSHIELFSIPDLMEEVYVK
jgi:hypothetical protein